MSGHTHYLYIFGGSFCRRKVEQFNNVLQAKCRSTAEELLVRGGNEFCTFVMRQEVKYAASRPALYQTPRVKKSNEHLVSAKTFISSEKLNRLFNFSVHVEEEINDDKGPSVKRMKVELSAEPYKNEVLATTLYEVLDVEGLVIDMGSIDETPPVYSPFNRSSTDLYMYHKSYCKQGIITSAACLASDSSDGQEKEGEEEEEVIMTCSGVLEMKNRGKVTKQLYAYMMHIGSQMTVKALKEGEIVDLMIVYGLAVNYENKSGRLYKLTVNFVTPSTVIEDFGSFSLVDAVNIVIERIVSQ